MSLRARRGALWIVLTAVLLQPTPHRLSTTVAGDLGDSMFLTWTLSWGAHALVNQPLDLFGATIFYPHPDTLALSDSMLSLAPFFGLVEWITGDAIVALNVVMVGLFILALVAGHALGRRLFGREDLAIVVAVVATSNSFVFGQQNHPQLQSFGLIPLCFLLLFRAIEYRRRRDGLALGLAIIALVLANVLYGLIWVVAALAAVATLAVRRALPPVRDLIPVGLAAAVSAGIVLGPVALVYRRTLATHGVSRGYEPQNSLGLTDVITPQVDNWSWGSALNGFNSHGNPGEHPFFVGFTALALGAVGLWLLLRSLRVKEPEVSIPDSSPRIDEIYATVIAGGVALVLALGPSPNGVPGPFRLFHAYVPGFDGVRVTSRFAVVTFLAGAVLVALATGWLRERAPESIRRFVVPIVVLAVLVEVGGPMARVDVPEGSSRDVYEALDQLGPGAVLELPMHTPDEGAVWPFVEAPRMYHSTIDRRPRVNGYSGSAPLGFDALGDLLNTFPSAEAVAALEELGVTYVILHVGLEQGFPAFDEAEALAIVGAGTGSAQRHGDDWLLDLESQG